MTLSSTDANFGASFAPEFPGGDESPAGTFSTPGVLPACSEMGESYSA
jgi:hypothetical protein